MSEKSRNILYLSLLFALLAAALLIWQPVTAQDPQPTPSDNDVNRVAKQMFCPVCENIPLDVCGTTACQEWRELIRLKLSQGWTDEQIKQYFAAQYGDRVLAEPPRRGLNWLVYVVPPVLILGGAVLVWRMMVSMKRKALAGAASDASPTSEISTTPEISGSDDIYLKQLEEELKKSDS